ncbi:MAG: GAF domain-containing protein, partial [Chloroflexota bacterium]|nr:GAF domain-containing protein [Chloroflexota bacterium]
WDDARKLLVLTATNGLSQSGVGAVKLGLGEGVTGWVAAQRQPLAVRDVRREPRFVWVPDLDQERFLSMLSVPILVEERVVGVMNVETVETHDFSAEEIDFVSAIAGQLGGIIELSQLMEQLARQLELEREAVAGLSELTQAKSDLMSMLSHDCRGPLSVAKAYLHGLRDGVGDVQTAYREIDAELQTLEKMADNLLASLQLEAQHSLVLDLERFSLNALALDQARRIGQASPEHPVMVTADAEVEVRADRDKVEAVLVNLLSNAVKYSPSGGPIEVRIERLEDEVEVSVTDRGIGLDEREIEALFERYGRGGNARYHGIAGHGLGLFICKSMVEAHGGRIYARPVPGGSRFAFTLPLSGTSHG